MEAHGPIWKMSYEVCEYEVYATSYSKILTKEEKEKFILICVDECKRYPKPLYQCVKKNFKLYVEGLQSESEKKNLK